MNGARKLNKKVHAFAFAVFIATPFVALVAARALYLVMVPFCRAIGLDMPMGDDHVSSAELIGWFAGVFGFFGGFITGVSVGVALLDQAAAPEKGGGA